MLGYFNSDNGLARFDSFNLAFWRIYENLCTWNEEKCLLEFYHNVIYDQQIKTNAKQKRQWRLTCFIKSCQQRKMVEYKTINHLLTKYLTYKNEHELANIVK